MTRRPEISVHDHADLRRFDFLETEDRYLFRPPDAGPRITIIGTGTMGQEHMLVTALEGGAVVHGIYDERARSVDVALREFAAHAPYVPIVYPSLDAALGDSQADAVMICTPNATHLPVLRRAVESGKHILLEKPMATTLADGLAIAAIARSYPAVLQIGLQYRFKAHYTEAAQHILERRSLGHIKTISMHEHRPPFLDKVGQWNKFSELSGGTLVEKCCHYFDLMNRFAGARPARVFATGGRAINFETFTYRGRASDIIDHAFVSIDYPNGVRAGFSLNMFSPAFHEELLVTGDAGRLRATETEDVLGARVTAELEVDRRPHGALTRTRPQYAKRIEDSGHHGSTYMEHRAFLAAIAGNPEDVATVDDGVWSLAVGVAGERSIRTGAPVDMDKLFAECGATPTGPHVA